MGEIIKIIIVDDHPFFRQGVRLFLNSAKEFDLVAEAESGIQALDFVAEKNVDVVLMDIQMPGMDGISATKKILEKYPGLRILVMTSFGNEDKIRQAIAAGAAGYCLKDAPPEELQSAIKAVAAGGTYLGRGIAPILITGAPITGEDSEEDTSVKPKANSFSELTQRESEVLEKLALGLSNKDIARELIVSEKTVKTHVANILGKLNLKTRTQAALMASELRFRGDGEDGR